LIICYCTCLTFYTILASDCQTHNRLVPICTCIPRVSILTRDKKYVSGIDKTVINSDRNSKRLIRIYRFQIYHAIATISYRKTQRSSIR